MGDDLAAANLLLYGASLGGRISDPEGFGTPVEVTASGCSDASCCYKISRRVVGCNETTLSRTKTVAGPHEVRVAR